MLNLGQGSYIETVGTLLFALAVLHTFSVKKILDLSHRYPQGGVAHSVLHLLGEIEIVFGLWAGILFLLMGLHFDFKTVVEFHDSLNFAEPLFVFCIMVIAATQPVLYFARKVMMFLSHLLRVTLRLKPVLADTLIVLSVGPLLGSLITEPAAMTVTALLLWRMMQKPSIWFSHFLLAVLFVNVSVGGALTPYAAPPVLMVAGTWNWDLAFMLTHFGWKSALGVFFNAMLFVILFRKNIIHDCKSLKESEGDSIQMPWPIILIHYLFLLLLVLVTHHPKMALGIFLFFIGVTVATKKYQTSLRFKESLLVAFFLGGIIVFGPFQRWWLEPILTKIDSFALFFAAVGLTAVTDNAALTYLGSQVPNLSDASKYFLVAGAIAGGGLTIIANAPNAAGYGILQNKFIGGVHPGKLFLAALVPTVVVCFFLSIY